MHYYVWFLQIRSQIPYSRLFTRDLIFAVGRKWLGAGLFHVCIFRNRARRTAISVELITWGTHENWIANGWTGIIFLSVDGTRISCLCSRMGCFSCRGVALSKRNWETDNYADPFAVAVIKSENTVGHVPRNISTVCSLFLHRRGSITSRVTGHRRSSRDLPQGGVEIPCTFFFRATPSMWRRQRICSLPAKLPLLLVILLIRWSLVAQVTLQQWPRTLRLSKK